MGPGQPIPGRMMPGPPSAGPPPGGMPPMMPPRHPGAPNGMCEYKSPSASLPLYVCVLCVFTCIIFILYKSDFGFYFLVLCQLFNSPTPVPCEMWRRF